MTVIAALVQDGRVHMASDTAGQTDGRITHHAGKLFTLPIQQTAELVGFGFAGQGALGSLVRRRLEMPDAPTEGDERDAYLWAIAVAEAVCAIASEATPKVLDSEGTVDGYALMGCRGRIWLLAQQSAVLVMDPFAAIGSGGDLATGALAAFPGDLMPARDQLEAAVEIACRFDSGCAVTPAGIRYEVL